MTTDGVASRQMTTEQLTLWRTTALSLIPGVIVMAVLVTAVVSIPHDVADHRRWTRLSITVAVIIVLAAILLFQGRRRNGRLSLAGVIGYTERTPAWQYVIFTLAGVAWAYFLLPAIVLGPDRVGLTDRDQVVFAAMPFAFSIFVAALNVILPLVEELYFRGFLLPRMERLGFWAPVLNVALFSVYHLWAPSLTDQFLRVAGYLPVVFLVWWKRDIRIAIVVHCSLDGIFNVMGLLR